MDFAGDDGARVNPQSLGRGGYLLLLIWLVIPLGLEILYSLLVKTVFGPKRYLLVYSPAYYMLLGLGFEGIRSRALKRSLSLSFLALFSLSVFFHYTLPTREDWRGAIRFMDRKLKKHSCIHTGR